MGSWSPNEGYIRGEKALNPVRVTILGASGPYPGSDDLPSVIVCYGRTRLLLDSGEGTQHRVHEAGFSVASIRYILITHMHGDHILGLLPLLQSRSLSGTETEITIIGPEGIRDYIVENFKLLHFKPRFDVTVIELKGDDEIRLSNDITVYVVGLDHGINTYGYVLSFGGKRTLAYITDTRPVPRKLSSTVEEPDVLIHDATLSSSDSDLALEYKHSTAAEAAFVAKEIKAKMLLLFHISQRYRHNYEDHLREARKIFKYAWVAEKFMRIMIK